ncbi:type II secretion system F family protein [Nocardioides massiliensis]|uniref:Tight adherence protein B n=1 Tax=Nocardioides massiliensis TaxID=1325935 RepID=A0ABT9NJ42_9ACTN|nr:type II secretion system F family protein [Nocardioides massiliensis]MDP9820436.1 tight adherence protein B [Nocardioides massiliensis]
MGVVVGLGIGVGLLLIGSAFLTPRAAPRPHPRPSAVRRTLDAAGLHRVGTGSMTALSAACGLVAAVLMQVVSRTVPVALAFGAIAAYLPVAVVLGRARRRRRELAEVWPEAVDNLSSAVRAGMSLPDALAGLADRGPEALRPAFADFAADYQLTGRFSECLDRLKERLSDPVGDRVIESLRLAREVGGSDLGRLLRTLSAYLREDARTRSELEARQAWAVNGARLAVAAPWLVLLLLSFQREVVARYASPAGVVVLIGGGVACVTAYRLMLRVGRLPEERRVLA